MTEHADLPVKVVGYDQPGRLVRVGSLKSVVSFPNGKGKGRHNVQVNTSAIHFNPAITREHR